MRRYGGRLVLLAALAVFSVARAFAEEAAGGEAVQGGFVAVATEARGCTLGRGLGRTEGAQVSCRAAAGFDVGLSRAVAGFAGALVGRARRVVERAGVG